MRTKVGGTDVESCVACSVVRSSKNERKVGSISPSAVIVVIVRKELNLQKRGKETLTRISVSCKECVFHTDNPVENLREFTENGLNKLYLVYAKLFDTVQPGAVQYNALQLVAFAFVVSLAATCKYLSWYAMSFSFHVKC